MREVYGVIERLCFLRIEETKAADAPIARGYLPLPVHGSEAKLSIKDDVSLVSVSCLNAVL